MSTVKFPKLLGVDLRDLGRHVASKGMGVYSISSGPDAVTVTVDDKNEGQIKAALADYKFKPAPDPNEP